MDTIREESECIAAAKHYMADLGWVIHPVRGPGTASPKAPFYDGWPDCRPAWEELAALLGMHPCAGIALNLGACALIDVEADGQEGEAVLDELCSGICFPCWRSSRGVHRLFRNDGSFSHLTIEALKIEFRAGRHYSILPPSLHESGELRYQWITSPFEAETPPLSEKLQRFYAEHLGKDATRKAECDGKRGAKTNPFPYRDDLDYVLRHFDLLEAAGSAGVRFVFQRPDANGNVPCYVPDALRGDNPDGSPSGVFNVRNGVLRDFATGKNHLFFHFMASLTGRPWLDLFREYEVLAGVKGRRPHSRRVSVPIGGHDQTEKLSLEEARRQLREYIHEQLSRPPVAGRLHIIKGPQGIGKTHAFCEELARNQRKAILLTLQNRLAAVHASLIGSFAGNSQRMPILRETECPFPDEYEARARLGYQPSKSLPCRSCWIGPSQCRYLRAFMDLGKADQLCCAAVYHTHEDFYAAYGNDSRQVVVFDENCIDLLLAPLSHPLAAWQRWSGLLNEYCRSITRTPRSIRKILSMVAWLVEEGDEFLKENAASKALLVPADLKAPNVVKRPSAQQWLNQKARERKRGLPPNLYDAALYLLSQPDSYVLLQRLRRGTRSHVHVRFRRKFPLPKDREVFILDATADEGILRAAAPGWDIHTWECPPLAQEGTVTQIMDYDTSRNFIKKEVRRHRRHSQSWLVQVLDAILEKADSAAFISFKKVATERRREYDILGQLRHSDKIHQRFHFPCRGIEAAAGTLIVLGTPYKDQATVLDLALALYGMDSLPQTDYGRQFHQRGCFVAANMGYGDPRMKTIERFVVSADLEQAVGRVRPLQNAVAVYVLSNAQIDGWEVAQVCASELFDLRRPLRRDAADNYERYAQEVEHRLDAGGWVGNPEVCKAISLNERTGRNHMQRFRKMHEGRLTSMGRKVAWKDQPPALE